MISINKDEYKVELISNTYFLSFDIGENDFNLLYVNFNSLVELNEFIHNKGILNLKNEWLDFICSDHIAETVEECKYIIGKVIEVNNNSYLAEVINKIG